MQYPSACSPIINENGTRDAEFQKIMDALEKKDKDGLKKLFAPNVLKEAKDMDASVDKVMELYQGRMKTKEHAMGTSDTKNDGRRTKDLECSYKVKTDTGCYYRIYFIDRAIDSKGADNLGIQTLKIIKGTTNEPETFYWDNETSGAGLFYAIDDPNVAPPDSSEEDSSLTPE